MNPRREEREVARASHCWFPGTDRAPGDAETTAWKRRARLRQARWREARAYPVGHEPYRGGPDAVPVGSRVELAFASTSGVNLMTPAALDAARTRVANPEPHQTLDVDRLWADLLSSMPLCFNLFGELAADDGLATRAVATWWPDAPTGAVSVRFEHSPGRRDPAFLGNRSAFDVAIEIALDDGKCGVLGVETKYHEHAKAEEAPKERALERYVEVSRRSGIFVEGFLERVIGTELQQLWLDHLLVLSMLQHPSQRWSWGRFTLVHPRDSASFARAAARYRQLLRDEGTFATTTIEALLASGVLTPTTTSAFSQRYLDVGCAND